MKIMYLSYLELYFLYDLDRLQDCSVYREIEVEGAEGKSMILLQGRSFYTYLYRFPMMGNFVFNIKAVSF
jgi:hypothetical protein